MAKITFETPCEIGDLFFLVNEERKYAGGKPYSTYSIQPVRVEYFSCSYDGKEKKLAIYGNYVNSGFGVIKPQIKIGENAFRDYEEAEQVYLKFIEGNKNEKNKSTCII